MTVLLGVDPGVSGALAWFDGRAIVHIADMPTVAVQRGDGQRERVNCALLADLLRSRPVTEACVERVSPRPGKKDKDGRTIVHGDTPMTAGYLMQAFGNVEGVLATLGIAVTFVDPQVWRRGMGVSLPSGASRTERKEASRLRALELFPGAAEWFRRKKDSDRAEAALVAAWLAKANDATAGTRFEPRRQA